MQNSSVVFSFKTSNKTNFCASISRPNAKHQNVGGQLNDEHTTNDKNIFMTNYDIENELKPSLSSDEKLIWTGKPKTGLQRTCV